MSADYDRLSELGHTQAQLLAQQLRQTAAQVGPFDAIVRGPARRHQTTATLLLEGLGAEGLRSGDIVHDPRLDEHDLSALIRAAASDPAPDPALEALLRDFGGATDARAKSKALHRLTESLVAAWIAGEREADDLEPWPHFSARVRAALRELCERRGVSLLVVTSVGPLAVMLEACLGLAPLRAFQTAWQARNSSVTEFIAGPRGITLNAFNLVAHLPEVSMHTHR